MIRRKFAKMTSLLARTACLFAFLAVAMPTVVVGEQGYTGPYLAGRLLVAAESMPDPRFRETVILMLEHDADGALGVALNRPIGVGPLGSLMAGFGMKPDAADEAALSRDVQLRNGGPVETARALVVHSTDYHARGSQLVGEAFAWTLDSSVLQATAKGRGPENMLVFMGYSGWGRGQLEKEIGRGDWLDTGATASLIFDVPEKELYLMVLDGAGLSL